MTEIDKFNNFKNFCSSINGISATYVTAIQACSFELFIHGIKQKGHIEHDQLIKEIIDKTGIDVNKIEPEIQQKFKRYLEYLLSFLK